ncbi:hypothetical protein KEM52_001441, partial [Ascosphaera acerosa]
LPLLNELRVRVDAQIEQAKADLDRERFSRIATAMKEAGGGTYSAAVVARQVKELERGAG